MRKVFVEWERARKQANEPFFLFLFAFAFQTPDRFQTDGVRRDEEREGKVEDVTCHSRAKEFSAASPMTTCQNITFTFCIIQCHKSSKEASVHQFRGSYLPFLYVCNYDVNAWNAGWKKDYRRRKPTDPVCREPRPKPHPPVDGSPEVPLASAKFTHRSAK